MTRATEIRFKSFITLVLAAGIAMLSGCVAPPAPETPRQSLLAAYGVAEAIADDVADLRAVQTITDAQAADMTTRLRQVQQYLDLARAVLKTNPGVTPTDLTTAKQILATLQQDLAKEHKK